jgi:hypothetical protein
VNCQVHHKLYFVFYFFIILCNAGNGYQHLLANRAGQSYGLDLHSFTSRSCTSCTSCTSKFEASQPLSALILFKRI